MLKRTGFWLILMTIWLALWMWSTMLRMEMQDQSHELLEKRVSAIEEKIGGAPVLERGPGGWARFRDKGEANEGEANVDSENLSK